MESYAKESIMMDMRAENVFSTNPYGFINGWSTTIQLFSYLNKCIDSLVAGGVEDTVYVHFAKKFNNVSHHRLPDKLKSYNFNKKILKWIKAFLSNRHQRSKLTG